mmetsp:Transcript_114441/g.255367  ORF Transcript_114441/g.255367 Transcript_114441/m.255367 type:complete len:200 (+) Transcript_114441:811-1410(+)
MASCTRGPEPRRTVLTTTTPTRCPCTPTTPSTMARLATTSSCIRRRALSSPKCAMAWRCTITCATTTPRSTTSSQRSTSPTAAETTSTARTGPMRRVRKIARSSSLCILILSSRWTPTATWRKLCSRRQSAASPPCPSMCTRSSWQLTGCGPASLRRRSSVVNSTGQRVAWCASITTESCTAGRLCRRTRSAQWSSPTT